MGTIEDFSHYASGMKRLERFLPRTRALVVLAACGVAAWYWHTALVILVCAALLIANYSADLATGLIIGGEALRAEISDLRGRAQDLEGTSSLREDIEAVKRVLGDIREELAFRDAASTKAERENRQMATTEAVENLSFFQWAIFDEEFDTVLDDSRGLVGAVRALRAVSRSLSAEARILRDAVEGIDPTAIRSMEQIREWGDHARERYEDHSRGLRSPYDRPETGVARLEAQIGKLTRKIEELQQRIEGEST